MHLAAAAVVAVVVVTLEPVSAVVEVGLADAAVVEDLVVLGLAAARVIDVAEVDLPDAEHAEEAAAVAAHGEGGADQTSSPSLTLPSVGSPRNCAHDDKDD